MKSLILLFLLGGLILIVVGYIQSNQHCPPPIVQFRYVPRTFTENEDTPIPVLSIFGKMFDEPSAWQKSVGYASTYNKYATEITPEIREKNSSLDISTDFKQDETKAQLIDKK